MDAPPLTQLVDGCLKSTSFYTLATSDKTKLWSCTLWFATDNSYNFYFISTPESLHMKNILVNPSIALSLFNPAEAEKGNAVGIQVSGNAHILTTKNGTTSEDIMLAYHLYFSKQNPQTGMDPSGRKAEDFISGKTPWQFVKIVPSELWYFDNRYFEEERQQLI